MAKSQYLEFTIWLPDAALVAQLQAFIENQNGLFPLVGVPSLQSFAYDRGVLRAPDDAAVEFADYADLPPLPIINVGDPIPAAAGGYITSPHFFANRSFPTDNYSFTKSTGWWIFGSTTLFYWAGQIKVAVDSSVAPPGDVVVEPSERENLYLGFATRHWVVGFENPNDGDNPASALAQRHCHAAARSDGIGHRLASSTFPKRDMFQWNALTPPVVQPREIWHRFYIRPLAYGGATMRIWLVNLATGSGGFSIGITSTGTLALFDDASASVFTLITTFGQTVLGQWTRVDAMVHADDAGNVCRIEVRVNGEEVATGSRTAGGVPGNRYWSQCEIGNLATVQSDHVLDVDDFIASNAPKSVDRTVATWLTATAYVTGDLVRPSSGKLYRAKRNHLSDAGNAPGVQDPPGSGLFPNWLWLTDPIDVATGSHVVRVTASGFSVAPTGWAAAVDHRLLANRCLVSNTESWASTTAGASMQIDLDLVNQVDNVPGSIGWVAFRALLSSFKGGAPNGSLGTTIGANPEVLQAVVENIGSLLPKAMTQTLPTSELVPVKGATVPVKVRYVKAADATNARIAQLNASVELIGTFGAEDIAPQPPVDGVPVPPYTPLPPVCAHLAEYPSSPYARTALPVAPVITLGTTYTGNGTGQDISFKLPPTLLWIRPLTGDAGGGRWFSGMLAAHQAFYRGAGATIVPGFQHNLAYVPASGDADQQQEFRIRMGGTLSQSNANGVVYQLIAWFDPAARFSRAWTSAIGQGATQLPKTLPLEDPTFTPEAAIVTREEVSTLSTTNWWFKGPGNTADGLGEMSGSAELANALTFGAGQVTARAGWVADVNTHNGLFLRRHDGNSHPDEGKVFFFGSYTGDGAASRSIGITPATGLRPMFLIVMPLTAAQSYHRDPSHTGTNSSGPNTGGAVANAITAGGVDSFTVGITLNTNAVVYQYFGFPGTAAAGNGGWSQNAEVIAVPADSRRPIDWEEPEIIDAPVVPPTPPSADPGDLTTDIAADCVAGSTRIVNLALHEIGITKVLTDLALDTSQEGFSARLIYKTLVDTVLRDFPWNFATEYADLELVGGTSDVPVNPDWQYSYRLPGNCLRVRRVCDPALKRQYSVTPIPFDVRSDGEGDLLLCDEPAQYIPDGDPITIEYTKRIDCPARVTDSQFRECLVFRLAAGLAKGLGRDSKDADRCLRNYETKLPKAKTQHANDQESQRPTDGEPDWITGR